MVIVCNTPAFSLISEFTYFLVGRQIVNKANLTFVGELINLVIQNGDALTEVSFIQLYLFVLSTCFNIYFGNLGFITSSAFKDFSIVNDEAFCKGFVIMWKNSPGGIL